MEVVPVEQGRARESGDLLMEDIPVERGGVQVEERKEVLVGSELVPILRERWGVAAAEGAGPSRRSERAVAKL